MKRFVANNICNYQLYVRCMTYNQKDFITDALNGFSIQRTNFPYACLVIDDASTDGEQEVLDMYIKENCLSNTILRFDDDFCKLIFAKHKSNKNCDFFIYLLKKNLFKEPEIKSLYYLPWSESCRYEALCEGDDYWVDPKKLQTEFDILEHDSEVSFVYTGFNTVNENGEIMDRPFLDEYQKHSHSGNNFFDLLINLNYIMTLTVLLRTSCRKGMPLSYYDYGFFLNWSRQGKAVFLPEKTACYRYNRGSITNTVKDSLLPRFYSIVLNEIKKAYNRQNTAEFIYKNKMFYTIMGYVIARNIRNSTEKRHFLLFMLAHPRLYYYSFKGLLIKLFKEDYIRKYVNNL